MDPVVIVLLVIVSIIVVGTTWGLYSLIVLGVARALHRRSEGEWSSFDRNAERLHRMTHPEDDSARKP